MSEIHIIPAVRPLVGVLTAQAELLPRARSLLEAIFGPVERVSEAVPFTHTSYYSEEMGPEIWRQFIAFTQLRAPEELAAWKLKCNAYEQQLGLTPTGGRKVNIDPGYLAPGKLVLASTKDHEHRVYLEQGIYAEITLRVRQRRFQTWDWTYPDYQKAIPWFDEAYQAYLKQLAGASGT